MRCVSTFAPHSRHTRGLHPPRRPQGATFLVQSVRESALEMPSLDHHSWACFLLCSLGKRGIFCVHADWCLSGTLEDEPPQFPTLSGTGSSSSSSGTVGFLVVCTGICVLVGRKSATVGAAFRTQLCMGGSPWAPVALVPLQDIACPGRPPSTPEVHASVFQFVHACMHPWARPRPPPGHLQFGSSFSQNVLGPS